MIFNEFISFVLNILMFSTVKASLEKILKREE